MTLLLTANKTHVFNVAFINVISKDFIRIVLVREETPINSANNIGNSLKNTPKEIRHLRGVDSSDGQKPSQRK
jgi:hypothetical protein